jgi:hypothetical protein
VSDVVSPPRPFGAPRAKVERQPARAPAADELILRNNRLSSINACVDDMQQYVHLKRLDLSHNAFKSLPQELVLLTALEHLDLSDCASLLVLPADLSGFKRLSTLLLARCGKLAELPVSLASLPSLQAFSFSHLSAAAPRALGVAVECSRGVDEADAENPRTTAGTCRRGTASARSATRTRCARAFSTMCHCACLAVRRIRSPAPCLLALAAADGKRFLHNDGIKHMRSFVERPMRARPRVSRFVSWPPTLSAAPCRCWRATSSFATASCRTTRSRCCCCSPRTRIMASCPSVPSR